MSRNGTGTYTLPAGNPVVTGTTISSTWANTSLSDIATALTQSLAKDGQTVPTANIPLGGFKITGLGAPTVAGDALAYGSSLGAVTATTGTFSGNVQMASANGGQLAGLRNKIINGDMRVAQRGTTGALTTGYTYISVDRFAGIQGTTANGILARVSAVLNGFQFAAKIGRNASATTTGPIVLRSALESVNSIPLQGKEVTFSFYAKAGANFSAASSNISVTVSTGTGSDQSLATMATWTGVATPITGTTAITTSWVRYSYTGTIAASATQVGVSILYTPVGTAGADDNLYVTGVQLEVGPVATPFEQRPIGMELALCQRYCFVGRLFVPTAPSTQNVPLPVPMRTTMATASITGTGTGFALADVTSNSVLIATQTGGSGQTLTVSTEL